MKDQYKTIATASEGEFKIKGSKFIAVAAPVNDEESAKAVLDTEQKKHPKARHVCFAFRAGKGKILYRTNDDGEPSNTAGKPILGQIDSFGLSNVIVVVTRYFGGTKLGVPGLINAYKTAAASALSNALIIKKHWSNTWLLLFDYSIMNEVMSYIKSENLGVIQQDFDIHCAMEVKIRQQKSEQFENAMKMLDGLKMQLLHAD